MTFLITTIHTSPMAFDDVDIFVDVWAIFGTWGSKGYISSINTPQVVHFLLYHFSGIFNVLYLSIF